MESIILKIEAHVAFITLNRPASYNSFNREMALLLQHILNDCAKNPDVRAICITGEGKAFCAGQDLKEVTDPMGPSLTTILREHYNPIILRLRKIEKPVIAAINGVAAGAGANIALACDIVVATMSATFIQAFSKIGLIPDSGGTYFLPRLIGFQRASALMMTGDKVSAKDAEMMGMIYKAIPDELFYEEYRNIAFSMSQMPTKALAYTKKALNSTFKNSLQEQLVLEDELQTAAGTTHDYQEGVNAFIEKRKPIFKGE